jgi:ABC-type multidrug transport system ATPase subunit/pSer/pThr/pTyr-binding forkhead associated (FHA) protein
MPSNEQNPTQSWIIGRAADCDVVSPEPTVSGHHCRLIREGDYYWVEDLNSPNGVYVNGTRVPPGQMAHLPPGAQVTLGRQVPMPWPAAKAAAPAFRSPSESGSGQSFAPPPPGVRVITIGRAPGSDKQVDLPIVSWNHARIVFDGGRAILEDLGSRNGTSIDRVDNRIQRAVLEPGSDVYLGSYKIAASELLAVQRVTIGEAAFDKVEFHGNSMVIGRDPQADVRLDYPMVSWRHARLTREAGGILVEDLGSRNGTFVGGIRVSGKVLAKPGQEIGLGSYRFQLLEGGELAQRKYHGNLTIEAADVVVNAPNGNRLIEPVSMTIFPSELVALMGPAGAGKTTLLKALNGYTKPVEGRVLFNGANLYDFYDRFRQQLGYVPQDDIVHSQLTVGEALYFSARLRTDLSDDEIRTRTVKVLDQLRMQDKKDTLIGSAERKTLSGGQRKRVNIALELINDTPVLFLDEPTSGLSSYDAESVIDLLKELSKQGKTIITTIHQPSVHIYKQFDDLIMVNRDTGGKTGAMVYFGPAYPDSIQFFNPLPPGAAPTGELSPEMLLSGVAQKSSAEWQHLYKASPYQANFVNARSGKQPAASSEGTPGDKPKRHFDLTQWFALVKRNTIVKLRDKTQMAILLLQAPLFAGLIAMVFHSLNPDKGFQELTTKLSGAHFLMVVAAIWFGCNNAARDIVGEWTVYKRERMVTLKLSSYVFSKLAVLFALCVFQCLSLLGIVYLMGLKSNFGLDLLVLVVAAMVGTGLGLCISAFSRTTESAIALLPVVLLPIIALGGGIRPVYKMGTVIRMAANAIPSRWAFEANMLHETGPGKWVKTQDNSSRDELPDLSDDTQKAQYKAEMVKQAQQEQANSQPGAGQARAPRQMPAPPAPADPQENPDLILKGDVAEFTIPERLITWKDKSGEHTARAFAGETKDSVTPVNFRHRFRESMLVLVGMLAVLMLCVHGILLKRDSDPQ